MEKATDYQKEFLEALKKLSYCRSVWNVWNDFLDMGCISISNSVPALYSQDRENEYLSIIGRYKKEEQELFPELFGFLVMALTENPAQDFLGEMYLSVSDPACGAGAMLIAFANVSREHGVNFQRNILFVAQDIDVTAVRMCYLQLAVLGCPAL